LFTTETSTALTGSPSKEQPSKSIGSRAPPRKKKNTRKTRPTKPLHKAGDYKTQPQIHQPLQVSDRKTSQINHA
jgi:hypothetical protein